MANHNSTVSYVEPNYLFSGLTAAANDGINYDRMPDLEDYCMAMNIGVEVSSREDGLRQQEAENKVLILAYKDNGTTSTINFMSGTKVKNAKDASGNSMDYRVLTTNCMDMYVTDLVDYGTTEMLGIKSINITYDASEVPRVQIEFTDVRGMSLFQPKELNYDKSFNGIRGLSKDNIAQTFFQCFFDLPLPKFTMQLKGFYGAPVTYQMACQKFNTKFNSTTGDFDISTEFIGFRYSFMTDISLPVLVAAPYSDYVGKEYWETQVKNGRFKLRGKNGEDRDMPRLYDVRENFEALFKQTVGDQTSSFSDEEKYHTEEIEKLELLKKRIKDWYEKFFEILQEKFGKEMSYLFKNGEGYDRILLLTNNKDSLKGELGNLYDQLDDSFKRMTCDLYSMIETYNQTAESFNKIKNLISPDLSGYSSQKIFKRIYIDINTNSFVFDGFDNKCSIPKEKAIKTIFPNNSDQNKLRKMYHDGIDEYIYAFIVEVEYASIDNRIASLKSDANMSDDERTKRDKTKRFNQKMFENMNWYPTIENFTRIVMAHLETLMAMMNNVVTKVTNANNGAGRTAEDLGVSLDNCSDINPGEKADNQFIPPFPRITRLETGDDGITKREDAWIGEFGKPGGEIPELDMINGLFNAINEIHVIEEGLNAVKNENEKEASNIEEKACVVKFPTTPYDFYIRKKIYGDDNDTSSNIYAFIGKICLRMFDVLAVNTFRYQYGNDWLKNAEALGKIEAMNFNDLVKIKNTNIFKSINNGGEFQNGEMVWKVITGEIEESKKEELPWGNAKLLNDEKSGAVWLDRYKAENKAEWVYPAQSFNFSTLEATKKQIDDNIYPNENNEIIVSDVSNPRKFLEKYIKSNETNAFFNFIIEEDRKRFNEAVAAATSYSDDESYTNLCKDYINKAIEYKVNDLSTIFAPIGTQGTAFTPSSFIDALPEEAKQSGQLKDATYHQYYRLTDDAVKSYVSCENNDEITNYIRLSEVFGCSYDSSTEKYTTNRAYSYFHHGGRSNYQSAVKEDESGSKFISPEQFETIFFLMGIVGINYTNIANLFKNNNSFVTLPKIAVLQIGAALAALAFNTKISEWSISGCIERANLEELRKVIPLPKSLEAMCDVINKMNVLGKMYLIKYFMNWANNNHKAISNLGNPDKFHQFINTNKNGGKKFDERNVVILRQNGEDVISMSKELLSMVIIVRGNVNSFKRIDTATRDTSYYNESGAYVQRTEKERGGVSLTRSDCKFTKAQAITYLDAFLNKLRQLNNIGDENGNLTQIAKTPDKTTDNMKLDVYRYLKQIYDKWIPTTDMADWKLESFFGDPKDTSTAGHQFHFIDSYYNKINHKLLINPSKLSERIYASIYTSDANVTMQTLLSNVYIDHRCFLKCIQNFADLGDGTLMNRMFLPVPYNAMEGPKIHPDFVVVYTYEPSRNLNIDNGEYKDDGFMLNDEMETPIAIRTRSVNDKDGYYKIPAFGVSYGRQYQSYFKNVSVGMESPIQTQQSLKAKHAILQSSRNELSKTVTSQDYYDIYSNQSYQCDVEMMGCAWVQPMMYFVLLNVPMFRGSYMIMKVTHSITPGNMVTKFTGCRMANVSNKLVQDIFSDEDMIASTGESSVPEREPLACIDNNCPYKTYPLIENQDDYKMSKDELTNANTLMGYMIAEMGTEVSDNQKKIIAAGIAGNMFQESRLNPTAQNASSKSTASGLVQWLKDGLGCMLENNYKGYYYDAYNIKPKDKPTVLNRLKTDRGAKFQCEFVIKSMRDNKDNGYRKPGRMAKTWKALLTASTATEAAKIFFDKYEGAVDNTLKNRQNAADRYYKNYGSTSVPKETSSTDTKLTDENIAIHLFNAIQKSLTSTNASAALKFEHVTNNTKKPVKPLIITQQDGKTTHLAKVFDIALNTPEYYQHVQTLYWACSANDGAQSDNPKAVVIDAVLKAVPERQKVLVADYLEVVGIDSKTIEKYNFTLPEKTNPEQVVNKRLLMPLSKKFDGKLNSHYPQFKSEGLFKETSVTECNNMVGNAGDVKYSGGDVVAGAKIKIGKWDVEKSVAWINTYARDSYVPGCKHPNSPKNSSGTCEGVCATYVLEAICCKGNGAFPESNFPKGKGNRISCGTSPVNGAATNLRYAGILEKNDFDIISSGNCTKDDRVARGVSLQAGDIAIIGMRDKGKYHACMWNGEQWVSDYKQGEKMSPYGSAKYYIGPGGTLPYAIYRYLYKDGVKAVKK